MAASPFARCSVNTSEFLEAPRACLEFRGHWSFTLWPVQCHCAFHSSVHRDQVRRACQGESGSILRSSSRNWFQSFGKMSFLFPFFDETKVTLTILFNANFRGRLATSYDKNRKELPQCGLNNIRSSKVELKKTKTPKAFSAPG